MVLPLSAQFFHHIDGLKNKKGQNSPPKGTLCLPPCAFGWGSQLKMISPSSTIIVPSLMLLPRSAQFGNFFAPYGWTTTRHQPHSTAALVSLDHHQLIFWCRKMAEYIENLRESNSRLQKHLKQEKQKDNLVQLPKNVNLTSLKLPSLIDLALSQQSLYKNSVLYARLRDTVTSLLKSETERLHCQSQKKSHPKGLRFYPVVLKCCVKLANKFGRWLQLGERDIKRGQPLLILRNSKSSHMEQPVHLH